VSPTEPTTPTPEADSPRPGGSDGLRVDDAVAALRALPFGGLDDSTRSFALPPTVRASVSPAIATLRWGAVGFGLAFAAPEAFRGSYVAVVSVAVCVFVTTWRTVIPIRLASERTRDRVAAFVDVVVIAVAVGIGGGLESPFIFSLMAAMIVVAFGWGYLAGAAGLVLGSAVGLVALPLGTTAYESQFDGQRDLALAMVLVFAVAAAAFVRARLLDAEARRGALAGQVASLSDANDLLSLVNRVARTLPTSLTLREALEASRSQIAATFEPRVICLLALDEHAEEWVPKLADGCVLHPAYRASALPEPLSTARGVTTPLLRSTLSPSDERVATTSQSGLYMRLDTRDATIGLLGLEHPEPGHFDERHVRVLQGMSEVLALTIDNARWFGRLRTLGAEEERVRLARDLHDRLGQWLTYIGFELERIMTTEPARTDELQHLYDDVQAALDELRETLRQLRSGVNEDQPLAVIGREIVHRFAERSDVAATFTVVHPGDRLPVPIENELLRIMQESLNNVAKHARAQHVEVVWTVDGGNFELEVRDDGRGFELARGVRDSAYGLVGMRERADVIGAQLTIESHPGGGTCVRVSAGDSAGRRSSSPPTVPMGSG
jgi:signal transduction histidine kinase